MQHTQFNLLLRKCNLTQDKETTTAVVFFFQFILNILLFNIRQTPTSAWSKWYWHTMEHHSTERWAFGLSAAYRFLRKCNRLRRRQAARREPPMVWVYRYPLPRPRELLPAEVRPRNSRCFCVAPQIQLILASRRMALWAGSIKITSKYLYEASWATQYEFNTRKPPRRRPTRSYVKCAMKETKIMQALLDCCCSMQISAMLVDWLISNRSKNCSDI